MDRKQSQVLPMAEYVVAIKRDQRDSAPSDWLERVREKPGVVVLGASSTRVMVEAEEAAIGELAADIGSYCIIEPMIPHHKI